jgi:hypothetical protein
MAIRPSGSNGRFRNAAGIISYNDPIAAVAVAASSSTRCCASPFSWIYVGKWGATEKRLLAKDGKIEQRGNFKILKDRGLEKDTALRRLSARLPL